MQKTLRLTWAFVVVSSVAVLASGGLLAKSFVGHALVDCRGGLRTVPLAEITDDRSGIGGASDLVVRFDEPSPSTYANVRAEWARDGATGTCSDAPIPWPMAAAAGVTSPADLSIQRDDVTGAYVVTRPGAAGGTPLTAFRRTNGRGHRSVAGEIEGHGVASVVFVVALVALAIAGFRLRRAWPYATRVSTWRSAQLCHDGRVEDEHETMLGRLGPETENALAEVRAAGGAMLVDPIAIDVSRGYREPPVLGTHDVRAGSHAMWTAATTRRMRDACMLAALAMLATGATAATLLTRAEGQPQPVQMARL